MATDAGPVVRDGSGGTMSYPELIEIREEILNCVRMQMQQDTSAPAASVQVSRNGCWISSDTLVSVVHAKAFSACCEQTQDASDACRQEAVGYLPDTCAQASGQVEIDEWIHHMLLHHCGHKCARGIAEMKALLESAAVADAGILDSLVQLFKEAQPSGRGRRGFVDTVTMYATTLWQYTRRREAGLDDGAPYVQHAGSLQLSSYDPSLFAATIVACVDPVDDVSYDDFAAHFLGRRRQEVVLFLYDLSKGRAHMLSKWLPIPTLDGLWHTGLVVFGWEYFYAGELLCDAPGRTMFGSPEKSISLGYTLRTRKELHHFLVSEIKPNFTREMYDPMGHNCNHFSDKLSNWLCGSHIPVDVLHQQNQFMDLAAIRFLMPLLKNPGLANCLGFTSVLSLSSNCTSCLPAKDAEDSDFIVKEVLNSSTVPYPYPCQKQTVA